MGTEESWRSICLHRSLGAAWEGGARLAQPLQLPERLGRAHLYRPGKPSPISSAGLTVLLLRLSSDISWPGHSLHLQAGWHPRPQSTQSIQVYLSPCISSWPATSLTVSRL